MLKALPLVSNKIAMNLSLNCASQQYQVNRQNLSVASPGTHLWVNAQPSPATKDNYARHAARLIAITGKKPEECTLADLQRYQAALNDPPASLIGQSRLFKVRPSPSSVVAGMQAIQSLFTFMHRAGVIQVNPALLIRTQSHKKRKRVDMPAATDFVSKCARLALDKISRPKDRLAGFAVLLLASTGLRASEAGDARMEDVFWRDGRPWLNVLGKGSKAREVVLPGSLLEIRKSITDDEEWLVPEKLRESGGRLVVWRMVKRAAALVGTIPGDVHPHLLRHFHASALLDSGVTLAETRDNLGHGNIAVTSLYLHADEDKRHAAISRAMDRLIPV